MRDPEIVLKQLSCLKKSQTVNGIFCNLYNPLFYNKAYLNLYSKNIPDNLETQINNLIISLKDGTYKPTNLKLNSKALLNDILIQEIIRMILSAIFEPHYVDSVHGFRANTSPHTALQYIKKEFKDTKWWLSIELTDHLSEFKHTILFDILKTRIREQKFISLINKFLKAGYFKNWKYGKTYSGVPKGTILSNSLMNIYFDKFDNFIANKIKVFDSNTTDICNNKLSYIRYGSSILLGSISSKNDLLNIKDEIKEFLKEYFITDNDIKLYHNKDLIRFLNYDISVIKSEDKSNGQIGLYIPYEVMKKYIIDNNFGKFVCDSKTGKPKLKGIHCSWLINANEYDILSYYNIRMNKLYKYYSLALNVSKLNSFNYICKTSFLRTLAAKYKTSCAKLYKNKNYCMNKRVGITQNNKFISFFDGPFIKVNEKPFNKLYDYTMDNIPYGTTNINANKTLKNKTK